MQPLDPADVYTGAAVVSALTGALGTRTMRYRYDRLSETNSLIEPLVGVILRGSVANNTLADIKRTASFDILDRTAINFLKDRIQPWACLDMPDGGTVEWPQGVFLLSTPSRSQDETEIVARGVEAYDQLVVLKDDKVENRYSVAAGTAYTAAIATLVATAPIPLVSIVPSALTLPAAKDWEPGTSKLQILNDLLSAINYGSAWFDEQGRLICRPYQSPADRAVEYTYSDGAASVRTGVIDQTIDLFDVPNKIVLSKSEPDQPALTSVATNTSALSPTSTVSRGRTIVDFRTEQDAPDQTTLDALAARYLFEASQVYESIRFSTVAMPFHSDADVLALGVPGLAIDAKYGETSWSLDLAVGARMQHNVRRVVTV